MQPCNYYIKILLTYTNTRKKLQTKEMITNTITNRKVITVTTPQSEPRGVLCILGYFQLKSSMTQNLITLSLQMALRWYMVLTEIHKTLHKRHSDID